MSETNRSILVRVPFIALALIFIPHLPYVNQLAGIQAAGWIAAAAFVLVGIGVFVGATAERAAVSGAGYCDSESDDGQPNRSHACEGGSAP